MFHWRMSGYSRGSLDVCLPLFFTHPYLHLDLHAAVRELLNHALDPYERLHLSEREREKNSGQGRRGELKELK